MEVGLHYDPEDIKEEFEVVASKMIRFKTHEIYLYDVLMGYWERPANHAMMRLLRLSQKSGRFLELGIGTGHLLSLLAEEYPNEHITGVDYSLNMIAISDRKLNNSEASHIYKNENGRKVKVNLLNCNCFTLPIDITSYNAILSSFLFDIQSPEGIAFLLEECKNRLCNNGSIFIATLDNEIWKSERNLFVRLYFSMLKAFYQFCYKNAIIKKLSKYLLSGYYTHCRPIDIETYVDDASGLKISNKMLSTIRILGLPILPVKIVEIIKT